MKQYPEIAGSAKAPLGKPCIAFYKYDGSNLRWEWSKKQGWHKFGTRSQLFNATDPLFGQAIPIFMSGLGDRIVERVRNAERETQRIIAYTEFFGPGSFAGRHELAEPKQLKLIDVELYKKGIMPPRWFMETFAGMPETAEVIYIGNMNQQFIDNVRRGAFPMLWEGVVAKGTTETWMAKIKTDAYFKKLNEVYGTEYRRYWE
jgi:hypothetical protein